MALSERLIVMDVDSTFINQEVIDLLGEQAGVGGQMAAITASAMRGELDFAASLAERVALLRGLPADAFERVYREVTLTTGAQGLVDAAHARGWKVGLVSGGFHEVVDRIAADTGVDHWMANRLEVAGGRLTGRTVGPVVTRERKLMTLLDWAAEDGVPVGGTIAIGDGANDIPMIQAAGIGIAFCAKPATRAAAPYHIDTRDLMQVLPIIDKAVATKTAL